MSLSDEIGLLNTDYIPYWNDGSWSLHQLLEYILSVSGPADVSIASFSISEESLRSLFNLCENGNIRKLICLFDARVKRDKAGLLLFACGITPEIYISNCHAKMILIENDQWNISVIGSANFTNNMRYECGMICMSDEFFFYKNKFMDAVKDAIPVTID